MAETLLLTKTLKAGAQIAVEAVLGSHPEKPLIVGGQGGYNKVVEALGLAKGAEYVFLTGGGECKTEKKKGNGGDKTGPKSLYYHSAYIHATDPFLEQTLLGLSAEETHWIGLTQLEHQATDYFPAKTQA